MILCGVVFWGKLKRENMQGFNRNYRNYPVWCICLRLEQQYNVSTSTAAKLFHFIHLHQESRDNIKSMTKRWQLWYHHIKVRQISDKSQTNLGQMSDNDVITSKSDKRVEDNSWKHLNHFLRHVVSLFVKGSFLSLCLKMSQKYIWTASDQFQCRVVKF